MLTPIRIKSNLVPQKFVNLGNGKWYYNYDIKSEVVEAQGNEKEKATETMYNYIQIKLSGKPEYKKCVECIIREYLTQSQEFDLINSYNRATLGILSKEEEPIAVKNYTDYLTLLSEIKSNIKKDFE